VVKISGQKTVGKVYILWHVPPKTRILRFLKMKNTLWTGYRRGIWSNSAQIWMENRKFTFTRAYLISAWFEVGNMLKNAKKRSKISTYARRKNHPKFTTSTINWKTTSKFTGTCNRSWRPHHQNLGCFWALLFLFCVLSSFFLSFFVLPLSSPPSPASNCERPLGRNCTGPVRRRRCV